MVLRSSSARRRVPRLGEPAWFAFAAGLPPSMADDPAIVASARRARAWRITAVITVIVLSWLTGRPSDGWGVLAALAGGWFLGGLLPELFVRHRGPTTVRVAGLDDRRAVRYLTPTARRWLIGSYAIVAGQAVITPMTGTAFTVRHLIGACIVLIVSVIGIAAVRRIARRSQPAGDAADVAVDDGIRFLATTRAVAGWAALQFVAALTLFPQGLTMSDRRAVTIAFSLAYVSYIGVIACWAWVPTRALPQRPIAAVDAT